MSENPDASGREVYRHESGAEMAYRAIGYSAMHGQVLVEGGTDNDDVLYLCGYRFEREIRPEGADRSAVDRPWPTWRVHRNTIAELCEVVDREAHDPFDQAGLDDGHFYVAYDREPDTLGRNVGTEERVYANTAYQQSFFDHPLSHLSARAMPDGVYLVFGYGPEGPSAAERRL